MCVYSMVIDRFQPDFAPWIGQKPWTAPNAPLENPQALKDLIAEFQKAQEAAKVVDAAMGAPDCEDPEKAKLLDRVAELEEALKDALGTYVLKDGEWYLGPSGAYCNRLTGARRFQGKEEAEKVAATLLPVPRCVKLVRK